jgi:hypothetical protein
MSFVSEFLRFIRFLWTRKKFWLVPPLVVIVILGALFVLTQGTAIAPFIYALF